MFPIAAMNGSAQINADVFGHWLSTVYMTLAQVRLFSSSEETLQEVIAFLAATLQASDDHTSS